MIELMDGLSDGSKYDRTGEGMTPWNSSHSMTLQDRPEARHAECLINHPLDTDGTWR